MSCVFFERSGNTFTQLSANNATQSRIFDLFDHIIWLGGGGYDFDQNAALTQYTMGRFLDGGNLLMSLTSSAGSPATGTIYELFPFDSLLAPRWVRLSAYRHGYALSIVPQLPYFGV